MYDAIGHFARQDRIGYVHFRNVVGRVPKYREVFVDEGDIDMRKALRTYAANGYDGVFIPDHTPQMSCAAPWHAGMAYALGYMRAASRPSRNRERGTIHADEAGASSSRPLGRVEVLPAPDVLIPADAQVGEGPVIDERTGRLCWVDILEGMIYEHDLQESRQLTAAPWRQWSARSPRAPRRPGFAAAVADGFGYYASAG